MKKILKAISRQRSGSQFYKIDLHFHSPSSKDQKYLSKKSSLNYKIPVKKIKDLLSLEGASFQKAVREVADIFAKRFIDEKLDLVAITDHNTPSFIDNDDWDKGTWYEAIREAVKRNKDCHTKVLPGAEITTARTHILAVFNDYYKKGVEDLLVQFKIANILKEIGFRPNEVGEYVSKTSGLSVYNAVQLIIKNGGVPIIAHIDGPGRSYGQSDFKWKRGDEYKFVYKGEMEAVAGISELAVIEYVNEKARVIPNDKKSETWMEAIVELRSAIKTDKGRGIKPSYGFIRDSDCHKFDDIAKRCSYVKMDGLDFKSLFYACREPENRLWSDVNFKKVKVPHCQIEGMAVEGGVINNAAHRFNPFVNCLIGGVSSAKSSRIHLLAQSLTKKPQDFPNYGQKTKKIYIILRTEGSIWLVKYELESKKHRYREIDKEYNYLSGWQSTSPNELKNFKPLFINCWLIAEGVKNAQGENYKDKFSEHCFEEIKKLIDKSGKSQPLIIDEPEQCLNDTIIEQGLIPLLKSMRLKRQLLITSSRSNIPVALDAENIIIVDKAKTVLSGALEYENMVSLLHQTTEGGNEIYQEKQRRYGHVLGY